MRSVAGSASAVLETRAYDPYGQPLASTGTPQTPFGFTGELADANGLLYLRARHYAPRLGAFPSLDPYEGSAARPMSLNGYAWVEGNAVNRTDPSGWNPIAPPVPMPYDQLVRWLAGGAAAAAALCTGPQAAACAALAGAALLAAGSATVLYAALVNSNWDAYRAYERVIAEANAGLHPYPPEITATPGAPAQPGYYPGERLNEDPFAGTVIYRATQLARTSTPEPEPDPTPSPARIPIPYDTCTSTPPRRRDDRCAQYRQLGASFSFTDGTQITDYDTSNVAGIVYRGLVPCHSCK